MRDQEPEQEYPLHQPRPRRTNGRRSPNDDEDGFNEAALEPRQARRQTRGKEGREEQERQDAWEDEAEQDPLYQHEEEASFPELPPHRLRNALTIGAVAGVLSSLQGIIITLINTPVYQKVDAIPPNKVSSSLPVDIAFTLAGLFCLTLFISILLYFIGGFITGKVAVQRRLGFLTGFVAGGITYLISIVTHYIPNYPGNLPNTAAGGLVGIGTGIIGSLIFLLLLGAFGGLISLFGTWLATRSHPYYIGY